MRFSLVSANSSNDYDRHREEDHSLTIQKSNPADDNSSPTRLEYNAGLDGLRGIGLLAILFYHSGVNWIPGGFLSVSTFFTLSGFLITSLLVYEWDNTGRIDMADFWARRFRRLMPGSLLALSVISMLGATIGDISQIARLRGDGLAALFYVSNWRFVYLGSDYADMFASPSLVQHFWSLSIEEQFYLTFPLLAIALLRYGNRRAIAVVLGGLALLSTAWMAVIFEPDMPTSRLYFGTDTRAAEILLGALLALWHAGRPALQGNARKLAIALGSIGLAGNLFYWFRVPMETAWLWQGGYLIYAMTTVAIIIGALQPTGPARTILSWRPFPWLGKISYGVYIYHFSFYVTLTSELTGLAPWPLFATRVAATFALAIPSYYLLEQPVRYGRLFSEWRFWAAMPVGIVTVAAMLILATQNPTVDSSTLPEPKMLVSLDDKPRLMIVGGSISFGIGNGLLRWARRTEDASVLNIATKGCGIARGGRLVNSLKRVADLCDEWPTIWASELESYEPDVVVVLVGGWDTTERKFPNWGEQPRMIGDEIYDTWLISEYEAALELLTSHGARVVWLTAPCLAVRSGGKGVWDPERTVKLNLILRRLEREHGEELELVDLNYTVCPGGEFTNELAGMDKIRPDGAHFSNEAEDWVAEWLTSHILASNKSAK